MFEAPVKVFSQKTLLSLIQVCWLVTGEMNLRISVKVLVPERATHGEQMQALLKG